MNTDDDDAPAEDNIVAAGRASQPNTDLGVCKEGRDGLIRKGSGLWNRDQGSEIRDQRLRFALGMTRGRSGWATYIDDHDKFSVNLLHACGNGD